jgi:branched-chain amino acid transport system ATP-binding protein
MTVLENLQMGAYLRDDSAAVQMDLDRVLALFPRLGERLRQAGGTLSGGEQQMLTIARTLMGDPEILLLDEPSEGLAPVIVRALGEQIAALKREGLTILLSEQNLKFAARLADRAYIIEKGEIRFDGPMTTLMADEALRRKYLTV